MAAAVVEETCLGLAANAEVLALLRARAEEAGGESELSGGDRRLLEYLQGVSAPPGESPPPPPAPQRCSCHPWPPGEAPVRGSTRPFAAASECAALPHRLPRPRSPAVRS